jgi:hypothetical protein
MKTSEAADSDALKPTDLSWCPRVAHFCLFVHGRRAHEKTHQQDESRRRPTWLVVTQLRIGNPEVALLN